MASLIRLLAIAVSVVIGASLVLFAVDQSTEGRDTQVRTVKDEGVTAKDGGGAPVRSREALDAPNPGPAIERVRETENSSARELIDDGNDLLASPFTGVASSDNIWVNRLIPTALGLLLFGLGGLMLANSLPQRRHEPGDWRETAS